MRLDASSHYWSDCMRMSESVTEFSEVLPTFFPPPTYSSLRVGRVVVVGGGCGGTDSGT